MRFIFGIYMFFLDYLFIIGGIMRNIIASDTLPFTVKELLYTRANYKTCGEFKDLAYNWFLEFDDEYYENRARYWQIRQVYEKARWSTLFGGFCTRLNSRC